MKRCVSFKLGVGRFVESTVYINSSIMTLPIRTEDSINIYFYDIP